MSKVYVADCLGKRLSPNIMCGCYIADSCSRQTRAPSIGFHSQKSFKLCNSTRLMILWQCAMINSLCHSFSDGIMNTESLNRDAVLNEVDRELLNSLNPAGHPSIQLISQLLKAGKTNCAIERAIVEGLVSKPISVGRVETLYAQQRPLDNPEATAIFVILPRPEAFMMFQVIVQLAASTSLMLVVCHN